MPYRIKFTKTATTLLGEFHPDLKKTVKASLREIAADPWLGKELQEELEGYFSYRLKRRYRIIYTFDESSGLVIVHLVWHRRNVYELLADLVENRPTK